MKSADWQNWYAGHLIEEMTVNGGQANPTDTILLDGHGPGFTLMMSVGYLNKITSGGNIREYNDRAPTLADGSIIWTERFGDTPMMISTASIILMSATGSSIFALDSRLSEKLFASISATTSQTRSRLSRPSPRTAS